MQPDPTDLARVPEVDRLLQAHQDAVYGLCLRLVGDPQTAAELAQETLLRAWEKLSTFRGEASFRSWLLGIARYECLNARRKHGDLLTEDGVLDAADPARSVLAGLHREQRHALVVEASEAVLDPLEQQVVTLRYAEQIPLDRIEALLELDAASGARGVLQRCRRKLRAELRRRLEALGHTSSLVRMSLE